MTTLLRNPFSRRKSGQSYRKNSRLNVESLGERSLPSVTAVVAPGGTLAINGDAGNNDIMLMDSTATQWMTVNNVAIPVLVPGISIQARSSPNAAYTTVANIPKGHVNGITFNGGAGNDKFNAFLLNGETFTSIDGGAGDDMLFGSPGNDVFVGSSGNDKYSGMFGDDLLSRNGYRGYFMDNGIGKDATTGLVGGKLSYGELMAPGAQLFARPNPDDPTRLQLYGPSGAGFEIKADSWKVVDVPSASATEYRAQGSIVKIDTGNGFLPLPAAAFSAVRVGYSVGGTTTKAGPVLTNLRLDAIDALGGLMDTVESKTGMNVSLPMIGGGIAMGASLGHLDLPVANAVPYIYGVLNSSTSVSIGDLSTDIPVPGGGWGAAVAVDPTDIGGMAKLTTPDAEIAFGWSQNGEIPYVPTYTPDDLSNPMIAGNLYLAASGSLPSLPVTLSGELVVDLDANDDGAWAGLTSQNIGKLARGKAGLGVIVDAMNDMKFGFNGQVDASLPITKSIDMDIPLGKGSLYWAPPQNGAPGVAAFRAKSANPFESTPFEKFFAGNGFDFQGWFNTRGDFRLKAESTGISVDLDIGGLSLGSVHQSFSVDFSKMGDVISLGAAYHFDLTIGNMDFLGARVAIDANLDFSVNISTGAISLSGSGSVEADLCLFGIDIGTTFGVGFDNHGVYIDMPGGDALDFDIEW